MNCPNCAAPVSLSADGGTAICPYCRSRTRRRQTATGIDRLDLTDLTTDRSCPDCDRPLVEVRGAGDGVAACRECEGVAVPRSSLRPLIEARRQSYTGADAEPRPIDQTELAAPTRRCPGCRRPMEVHPYFGPGSVVIDSCDDCAIAWLDVSELTQIEQAPGPRQRRPDPAPWRDAVEIGADAADAATVTIAHGGLFGMLAAALGE